MEFRFTKYWIFSVQSLKFMIIKYIYGNVAKKDTNHNRQMSDEICGKFDILIAQVWLAVCILVMSICRFWIVINYLTI